MRKRLLHLSTVVIGCFSLLNVAAQNTIFVDNANVSGTYDGTTWATAYSDFTTAISSASSGDSVFVAKGTYQPASGMSFFMKAGVKIYGSFEGTEMYLNQRNLSLGIRSILKGNNASVISNNNNGLTHSAILDGFRITEGTASGIMNIDASPTFSNLIIDNNTSTSNGGGINNTASNISANPLIINTVIYNNSATSGGGLYISNYNPNAAAVKLVNVTFHNNTASNGGAIATYGVVSNSFNTYYVHNSIIWGNSSPEIDNNFKTTLSQASSYIGGSDPFTNASNPIGTDGIFGTSDDGLMLSPCASAVNVGNNSLYTAGSGNLMTDKDISGQNRLFGSSIDIGAYELQLAPSAPPSVSLGNDTSYCAGTSFSLTLDAQNPGSTYTWSDNSGNQTLTVTTAGTYHVTVTDANGCKGKDTIVITEKVLPTVSLGADTAVCAGASFTKILDAGNPGSIYLWSNNSGNQTLSVSTPGVYSVTVLANNGCYASAAMQITTKSLPVVNLGADTSYCVGTPFTLNLNAGNTGSTFVWNDNSTNQTLVVDTAGTYKVTVTSLNMCSSVDSIKVTENTLPTVSLGTDTAICQGTTLTVDAGNAGATFLWNDNSTNQTLAITATGTYHVIVTDANGCSNKDSIDVTTNALPIVSLGADTSICEGTTLTVDAENTGATFLWNDNSTNQTLAITAAGTYSVSVTDANGCVEKDTIKITVNPLPSAGTITFTDNGNCAFDFGATNPANISSYKWVFGDGDSSVTTTAFASHSYAIAGAYTVDVTITNDCGSITKSVSVTCEKVGVKTTDVATRLALYPNPTANNITLSAEGVEIQQITITDNLGKVIHQANSTDVTNYEINVSHFANGFYTMLITTDNGIAVKKFEVMK